MSMIKFFSPDSWDDTPGANEQHQIKIAASGLGISDKFAAKKFASDELLHWLSLLKTNPDGVYVHKVAMSSSDNYGPNRWGDGFTSEALDRDCCTFEQHAKAYRNHKSKKGSKYYGAPKIARFRPDLGTVELVTEYYGTDKFASENGGSIADFEIDRLNKYGSIPVSMGSHVPGDRCQICSNWAPTRKQHCTSIKEGGLCTLFGCKNGMLKIAEDGRQQYVDNPYNCFFDISSVTVGADPVANGLVLPLGMFDTDSMAKTAEYLDDLSYGSRQIPDSWVSEDYRLTAKLAYLIADIEQKVASLDVTDEIVSGFVRAKCHADLHGLFHGNATQKQAAIRLLAVNRQMPTFEQYAKAAGEPETTIKRASRFIPNIYTRLVREKLLDVAIIPGVSTTNFTFNKTAAFDESLEKVAVVTRGVQANATGNSGIRKRMVADLSETIPAVAIKYAGFKLAWACLADIDHWTLNGIVMKELGELN